MRAAHSVFIPLIQINMPLPNNLQLDQKEGRMALAIQAYKQGHFSSRRAAAGTYDVPESTFRSRVKGVCSRRDSEPRNRKLTTTEESTLVQWILSMDQRGLSPRSDAVRQMANLLLQKRSDLHQDNHPSVGKL
jgi:hypothetical protein